MRLLLCLILLFPSSLGFSKAKSDHSSKMDKIIHKFEEGGGSKKGVQIIKSHPLKMTMAKEDKAQIKLLKEKLDKIVLAKSFDGKAFTDIVKQIKDLHSKKMDEKLQTKVQILSELSVEDRKIIYAIILKQYHQHHSSHKE